MAEPIKTVAVLVANPALSSILSMTLAGASSLRVRPFETQVALQTYLHLAPADLVVADFDSIPSRADKLAEDLHHDRAIASRDIQIIALASELTAETKMASIHAATLKSCGTDVAEIPGRTRAGAAREKEAAATRQGRTPPQPAPPRLVELRR